MILDNESILPEWDESIRTALDGCADAPLSEDEEAAPEKTSLECRVDTLEHRLGRALLCVDDCREELEHLRGLLRQHLTQQQAAAVRRRRRILQFGKYLAIGAVAAALLLHAKPISELFWQLFCRLAGIVNAAPEQAAGFLLAAELLRLLLKLGQHLGKKQTEPDA